MLPFALLDVAKSLLEGPVLLSQADCWVKYSQSEVAGGHMSNQSQRMHADWGNNQLAPPTWTSPTAVAALICLDGPEDGLEGGGTAVVPRSGEEDPAYAHVPPNSDAWPTILRSNVEGTRNIFEACAQLGVE